MSLKDDYRRTKGRGDSTLRRYQGKEVKTHIQANSQEELDEMIRATQDYSNRMGTGPVEVLDRRQDPDGGYEATLRAHNWNPIKWVKEKIEEKARRDAAEAEHRRKQREGDLPVDAPSPKEQEEEEKAKKRTREAEIKAAARMRGEKRERGPTLRAEAGRAFTEAEAAEERAKVLETELYGAPLVNPVEIIRDRWGKKLEQRPLGGVRREEAAKLEMSHRKIAEQASRITEKKLGLVESELDRIRKSQRRGKIMGPVGTVARGVAGAVESTGRAIGGFGIRTSPYRMRPPSVIPGRLPSGGGLPRRPDMDLSSLRRLQTTAGVSKIPLFGAGARQPRSKGRRKPRGRNSYEQSMRKMRRSLFGGR